VSVAVPDEALDAVYPGAELAAHLLGAGDAVTVVLDLEQHAASTRTDTETASTVMPAAGSAASNPGRETR